ncbi:MAG: phosphopantetheine-binding protein [Chloroflexota bacterium]
MKTIEDVLALTQKNELLKMPEDLQTDAPLAEQGIDSLDLIMLFHEVEGSFGIKISEEQAKELQSLEDIVNFLNVNT